MHSLKRAIFVAPLVPGLFWAVLTFSPVVLLFAVPLGYLGMLAFGLPLYYLVCRYWRVTVLICFAAGALSGGLAGLVFLWLSNSFKWSVGLASSIALFAGFGAISGILFWWLGKAGLGAQLDELVARKNTD